MTNTAAIARQTIAADKFGDFAVAGGRIANRGGIVWVGPGVLYFVEDATGDAHFVPLAGASRGASLVGDQVYVHTNQDEILVASANVADHLARRGVKIYRDGEEVTGF